jgi:hypothetical protein
MDLPVEWGRVGFVASDRGPTARVTQDGGTRWAEGRRTGGPADGGSGESDRLLPSAAGSEGAGVKTDDKAGDKGAGAAAARAAEVERVLNGGEELPPSAFVGLPSEALGRVSRVFQVWPPLPPPSSSNDDNNTPKSPRPAPRPPTSTTPHGFEPRLRGSHALRMTGRRRRRLGTRRRKMAGGHHPRQSTSRRRSRSAVRPCAAAGAAYSSLARPPAQTTIVQGWPKLRDLAQQFD